MERWFLTTAAAVTAAAALASCGGASTTAGGQRASEAPPPARAETPETALASCTGGFSFSKRFARDWRRQAIIAGPIALLGLRSHEDGDFDGPRRRAVYTKALLAPHRTTTVAVAAADRPHVSLSYHVSGGPYTDAEGERAITFEGCPPRVDDTRKGEELGTGYAFAVILDGARCATFEITPQARPTMRRTVGFGTRDC